MRLSRRLFLLLIVVSVSQVSQAGWRDDLKELKTGVKEAFVKNAQSPLSEDVIAADSAAAVSA